VSSPPQKCGTTTTTALSPELKFYSLRQHVGELLHRGGPTAVEIARFMGHAKVANKLGFYAHLSADSHADAMAALGAMDGQPPGVVRPAGPI
jgi:hypothetical protein